MTTTPAMRTHFLIEQGPVCAPLMLHYMHISTLAINALAFLFACSVEQKRKKRMKKAGVLKEETESYDSLV